MRRFLVFVLFAVIAVSARAQFDAATVLGTVTDPSGAVVAHSQVALRNTATATQLTAVSDEQGQFRFVNVRVGPYRLEVIAAGFKTSAATFELTVGARQRVDVQLVLANVASSVIATAEAAQLETESSEHSQVIADREIAELPLDGREYSQLVELSTGVVPSPSQTTVGYDQREGSFNINGLRSVFNNFMLDGVDNNSWGTSNQGFSNQVVQLPPDSVAEFSVVTNNMSAEYGHSGGGTINVVTRYGTNQLHGRGWEFVRNTVMNAPGAFKPDQGGKPALRRNQFGGNLGGPILRDKAFFFLDYEGYRESSSLTDHATLPTASERGSNGTYAQIDDPTNPLGSLPINNPCPYTGTNPCNSATYFGMGLGAAGTAYQNMVGGTQYLTGQIPVAAITPFAKAVLAMLPATTNNNSSNNYVTLHPIANDRDKGDAKIDYDLRKDLRLFARYSQSRINVFDPGTIPGAAGGDGDGHVQAPTIQIVGGATWTINTASILEARFGFSRQQSGKTPVLSGGPSMSDMFGLTGLPTDRRYTGGITYQMFADGGFTNLGREPTSPQHQYPTVWNPKLNYTRLLARHTLKAGMEFTGVHVEQEDLHPVLGADVYGAQMSGYCYYAGCYAGVPTYGPYLVGAHTAENNKMFDYADFLLGYRAEIGQASPNIANIREWGWAGYLQDDIKLNRKLTLNLGLRYEFFTPVFEANNHLANFNPTTNAIVVATNSDRYTIDSNKKDLAPRVGAAYSIGQRTVLRGGFGMSYVHWNRIGSNYLTQSAPYGIVALRFVAPSLSTYINTQSGYPTAPSLIDPTKYDPTEAILQYMPRNSPDARVNSWFFSVQQDMGHKWMLDLSYVGNSGTHEVFVNDINQSAPQATNTGGASVQSRRYDQAFGSVIGTLPWGTSNYNGLQAKLEKRFASGLYLLNSFTWSKAIDIAGQSLDGGGNCSSCGNGIPSVQNFYNWKADRGISAYNRPLVNITSVVWSLPVGQGQWLLSNANHLWNTVLGGWQATEILQTRSGDPLTFGYSPTTSQEVSPTMSVYGQNAYRPNQNGSALARNRSRSQYFNTASFSVPAVSTPFGNSPRNAVSGFPFWQLDMGLTKDFHLTEKSHLQFRAESFNLFNHTNLGDPNTLVGSTTFGQITSALPARELQIAAKIVF